MASHECRGCGNMMSEKEEKCKYCGSSNPNYVAPKFSIFSSPATQNSSTDVEPVEESSGKKMSVGIFILLLIFCWPGAIIYLIVCTMKK